MGWTGRILTGAVLAVLAPYLYERQHSLASFYTNAPSRLQTLNNLPGPPKTLFSDVVRNCEDLVLDTGRGIVIISCDPGRDKWNTVMGTFIDPDRDSSLGTLWWWDYGAGKETAPKKIEIEGGDRQKWTDMHPLGVALHEPTRRLYVVNHAKQGPSIELFTLSGGEEGSGPLRAVYTQTLTHPLLHTPNSIAPLSEHEILFTNDHYFEARYQPLLSKIETYLAIPGGNVVYHNLATNETKVMAHLAFANGVEFLNSTHIAVSSSTTPSVNIYRFNATAKTLSLEKKLYPRFCPDNLSVDGHGKLLIAGHPHGPSIEKVSKTNREFDLDGTGEGKPEQERFRAPSWVAEWDGNEGGVLKDLHITTDFGTACTAVRDVKRKMGFASGLYEKGLLMWDE